MNDDELEKLRAVADHWLMAQRWDRAEPVLRSLLAVDPYDAVALHGLAIARIRLGAADEAEVHARALTRHHPDNPDGFIDLAHVYSLRGDDRTAIDCAREALKLAPHHAYCHAIHALVLHRAALTQEAHAAALTALQLDPGETQAIGTLALCALELRMHEQAGAAARELMRLAPVESFSLSIAAEVFTAIGHRPEGLRMLQQLLRQNPADDRTHQILGQIHWKRGDAVTARKHFREALRLNPKLDEIRKILHMRSRTLGQDMPKGWEVVRWIEFVDEQGHRHVIPESGWDGMQ